MKAATRSMLLVAAAAIAMRLPFLTQAVQGDDLYYLAGAQHALVDPLHPHHARYAFLGAMVDMRGHPHPPGDAWFLAALLAVFGDVREPLFHAAYIGFSVIAALATLSLARRFSPRPVAATLLAMAAPAFIVNGTSFEADVPFLAFWLASLALFLSAVDRRSAPRLSLSAAAMTAASLFAFQGLFLVPVLALYLLVRRSRWIAAWATLAVPPAVLLGWQLFEAVTGGGLPAAVLGGYMQSYGWQKAGAKLRSAVALTVHAGWIVFPALAAAAFGRIPKLVAAAIGALAAVLAFWDPNPLFWLSWAIGAGLLVAMIFTAVKTKDADERFLAGWVLLFFSLAVLVFFAGAARYLLPIGAAVAILTTRWLAARPGLLAAGAAASAALGLALAAVNAQHWNQSRAFVASVRQEIAARRTWINADWGTRWYAEAEGGLPLLYASQPRAGDLVVWSDLGALPGSKPRPRAVLAAHDIVPSLPLRLICPGCRSAYSTAALGLRPFDISTKPVDRLRAEVLVEAEPSLTYLPMNAPEAESQIVSGVSSLESNAWRWTERIATVRIKSPGRPLPLEADIYVPEAAGARRVQLLADGAVVAEATCDKPGPYLLRSRPFAPEASSTTVVLAVDRTFQAPGDRRELGVVLKGIGFRP